MCFGVQLDRVRSSAVDYVSNFPFYVRINERSSDIVPSPPKARQLVIGKRYDSVCYSRVSTKNNSSAKGILRDVETFHTHTD